MRAHIQNGAEDRMEGRGTYENVEKTGEEFKLYWYGKYVYVAPTPPQLTRFSPHACKRATGGNKIELLAATGIPW